MAHGTSFILLAFIRNLAIFRPPTLSRYLQSSKGMKTNQIVISFVSVLFLSACSDLMTEPKPFKLKGFGSGYTDGAAGTGGGAPTGGSPSPILTPPPNMSSVAQAISDANPGMINDCTGQPIANNFLITVVRALQQRDSRWGFMIKDGGARIPRDILAYAWSDGREGTQKFFVIDFVMSGCANNPGQPEFDDPATGASVGWIVHNLDTGYADNGVWSYNP